MTKEDEEKVIERINGDYEPCPRCGEHVFRQSACEGCGFALPSDEPQDGESE